jgi:hypothetical protein
VLKRGSYDERLAKPLIRSPRITMEPKAAGQRLSRRVALLAHTRPGYRFPRGGGGATGEGLIFPTSSGHIR